MKKISVIRVVCGVSCDCLYRRIYCLCPKGLRYCGKCMLRRAVISLSGKRVAASSARSIVNPPLSNSDLLCETKMNSRYACDVCIYFTNRIDNYRRHMRKHTGEMFQCDVCGIQSSCRHYLQKHKQQKHFSAS